jgi:hypothetical protein
MYKEVDHLCGLVVRVPGYWTEMYCVSSEVRTECIYVMYKKVDHLCGLVVRVPGYWTEMYCVSSEVRTEFIYVMYRKVDRLCGLVVRVLATDPNVPGSIPGAKRFFWEVVGLERGPLVLVSTIEEVLERKNSGSGLENRECDLGIRHTDHVAPSIRKGWHYPRQQAAGARYISLADSGHAVLIL